VSARLVEHGTRILAALVLLAVVSLPIRLAIGSSRGGSSPRPLPPGRTCLKVGRGASGSPSARPSLIEVRPQRVALEGEMDADVEDQTGPIASPDSTRLDIPSSPRASARTAAVGVAAARAARPLRC